MNENLRFTTIKSSKEILEDLYSEPLPEEGISFACDIVGVARSEDSVWDATARIYLDRMGDDDFSYQLANKELIYRTKARLLPEEKPFDVDVFIHTRNYSLIGATVIFSVQVWDAMDELASKTEALKQRP